VADVWYYADGGDPKGPFSFRELIHVLSGFPDLKRIFVWRNGFEEWEAADQVREIGAELLRPRPIRKQKPELTGIAGWLDLVALQQVVTLLRTLVLFLEYISTLDKNVIEKFPIPFLGEAAMNVGLFALTVYTSILFFRRSRKFPKFLILEWILFPALPFIDAALVSATMDVSFASLLDAKDIGQSIALAFVGAIWIAYILRSKRVANTFVK
jgi:hypothetical protein